MAPDRERDPGDAAAEATDVPPAGPPSTSFASHILQLQRSAGNRAVGRLLAGSPPRRSLARAPWYRGQIDQGIRSPPGGHIHDFGDGVYIAETAELGGAYAALRSAREKDLSRAELLMGDIPDEAFFRTLDLRADPRWAAFLSSPWSGDPALGSWRNLLPPNGPNENYGRVFMAFLRQYDIRLEDYDSVIGEEMVRGGTQVCLRTPRAQQEVLGRMTVVGRGTQIPQVAAEAARAAAAAGGGGGGSGRAGTAGGVGRRNPVVRVTIPRTTPVEEPPAAPPMAAPSLPQATATPPRLAKLRARLVRGGYAAGFGASMLLGIAAALLRSSLDQRIIDHQLADLAPELDAAVRARIPDALEVRADDPELPVYLRTCVRVARTSTTDQTEGGTYAADLPIVTLRWVSIGHDPWSFTRSGWEPHLGYRTEWTEFITSEPLEGLIAGPLVVPGAAVPDGGSVLGTYPTF